MDGKELAYLTAKLADDKRANDIVVLDMRGISSMADYFLICHGNSDRQVQAIAQGIRDGVEEQLTVKRIEGYDQAKWILIDMGDVIAHVFQEDERLYYQLEKLWGDAPLLELEGHFS